LFRAEAHEQKTENRWRMRDSAVGGVYKLRSAWPHLEKPRILFQPKI